MTSLEKKTETKLTLDVKELGGKTNGTVDLPATIFDAPANIALHSSLLLVREPTPRRLVARFAVAARSRTARREPVAPVRVRRVHLSSSAVARSMDRSRVTTASAHPRR